jgi:hypothetical protein
MNNWNEGEYQIKGIYLRVQMNFNVYLFIIALLDSFLMAKRKKKYK